MSVEAYQWSRDDCDLDSTNVWTRVEGKRRKSVSPLVNISSTALNRQVPRFQNEMRMIDCPFKFELISCNLAYKYLTNAKFEKSPRKFS